MFWSGKTKNRKWQSRPQLYKGRMYYIKQVLQLMMSFLVVAALVSLFLYFKNSDALSIQTVEVLGELNHIDKNGVVQLSGIKKNDHLFALSLKRVQQNIKRFSWVSEVRVRREFPDTIQIHITERSPVALLNLESLYLVDQKGAVFKKVEKGDPLDLPVISGFTQSELQASPRLMKTYLTFCLSFLNYVKKQAFYADEAISEVYYDQVYGLSVFTKESAMEVYYGREEYKQKQAKLEKFKLSKEYQNAGFVRIDLDSPQKVIARKL